jgi:hypothetical protein
MRPQPAALIASLVLATSGGAQPIADHLKCYKVKDSRPKASYTADLQGLSPESGCTIKLPGKLLCVETTKTNVQPTPPGLGPGGAAGRFVCYAVKCPKAALPTVTWRDQFGAGTLTPKAPKLLCAPEVTTTSTTTTSTSTTTSTTLGVCTCYFVSFTPGVDCPPACRGTCTSGAACADTVCSFGPTCPGGVPQSAICAPTCPP